MDPQQILARLKALTESMTPRQLATLAGTFIAVVAIVAGSAWWMTRPTYAPLYVDMDTEAAGQMIERVKALKVPYRLDDGGRTLRVPAEQVDELRLQLSTQGLPASGHLGWEIFDRMQFGATDFLEQTNYQRALEGEISRALGKLNEIAYAEVHLAMPKESVFGDPRPAKASVLLKLRGQRGLSSGTVAGITNMVAASVPSLRAEDVVIMDSRGTPLARPNQDRDDVSGAELERQQRIEKELAERVVAMLNPVVGGPERVRATVTVALNRRTREETEEIFDKEPVIRSSSKTSDVSQGGSTPTPVAGTRANLPTPPGQPGAPAAAPATQLASGPSSQRTSDTINNDISKKTSRTIMPAGEIARVSVSVVVDDAIQTTTGQDGTVQTKRVPRTPQELEQLKKIVSTAVGFTADRGDEITLEHHSFYEAPVEQVAPVTMVQRVQQYTPQIWEGARILMIGIVALVALLFVIRPLMSGGGLVPALPAGSAPVAALAAGPAPKTVADLQSELEAQMEAEANQNAEPRRLPVLTKRATALSQKEPENVAKLLRSWISERER